MGSLFGALTIRFAHALTVSLLLGVTGGSVVFAAEVKPDADNPFTNATGDTQGGIVPSGSRGNSPVPPRKPDDPYVWITREECRRLTAHLSSPDAAYKPGVDAHGNPVAPADLDDPVFKLPDTVEFQLNLSPFEAGGRADLARLFPTTSLDLGKIEVNLLNNQVTLDGKPLEGERLRAITDACMRKFGGTP